MKREPTFNDSGRVRGQTEFRPGVEVALATALSLAV